MPNGPPQPSSGITPPSRQPETPPSPPPPEIPTPPPSEYEPLTAEPGPGGDRIIPIIIGIIILLVLVGGGLFAYKQGWIGGGLKPELVPPEASPIASPPPGILPEETPEEIGEEITPGFQANDQQRKTDLQLIKEVLAKYYADKGEYPISPKTDKTNNPGGILAKSLIPNYLKELPVDPVDPKYYYGYRSDGKTFELTCVLENTSDPEGKTEGNYFIYKLTP